MLEFPKKYLFPFFQAFQILWGKEVIQPTLGSVCKQGLPNWAKTVFSLCKDKFYKEIFLDQQWYIFWLQTPCFNQRTHCHGKILGLVHSAGSVSFWLGLGTSSMTTWSWHSLSDKAVDLVLEICLTFSPQKGKLMIHPSHPILPFFLQLKLFDLD